MIGGSGHLMPLKYSPCPRQLGATIIVPPTISRVIAESFLSIIDVPRYGSTSKFSVERSFEQELTEVTEKQMLCFLCSLLFKNVLANDYESGHGGGQLAARCPCRPGLI